MIFQVKAGSISLLIGSEYIGDNVRKVLKANQSRRELPLADKALKTELKIIISLKLPQTLSPFSYGGLWVETV